jgi:hypothetical protein
MTEKNLPSGNKDATARSKMLVDKIRMRLKEQAEQRSGEQMRLKVKEAMAQRGGSRVVIQWLSEDGRSSA